MEAIAARQCPARSRTEERAQGKTVVREPWTHVLKPGEVGFPGARMLLLVRQQHWKDEAGWEGLELGEARGDVRGCVLRCPSRR